MNLGIIMNLNKTNVSFSRLFAKIKNSRKFTNLQFCLWYSSNNFIFMGGGGGGLKITLVQEFFFFTHWSLAFYFLRCTFLDFFSARIIVRITTNKKT